MQWYDRTTIAAADLSLYEKDGMKTTGTRSNMGPLGLSSVEDSATATWAAGLEECPDCGAPALISINEYGIFHCLNCDNRFSMGVTGHPYHGDN